MKVDLYSILLIAVVAAVTVLLRFVPFLIFNSKVQTPKFVTYLGNVLPFAIMAMLVVFCLKGVSFTRYPYGIPEIIAALAVAGLHAWRRSTLLSITAGTVLYMILIQFVFV